MAVNGWVQACEWQRRGSELTADVALDGIILPIEDLTDFDDAGGILSINDQTIAYDDGAVDEDAGTILVNTGLAAAAATGDPVYTYAGGQVLQDVVLFVDCGDGDLVEVRVPFAQRDYWPEGDYDDPVQIRLSNDLERVLDAPGRIPQSTELTEARGGYEGTLQDIYDAADAAATAAADAASNATVALTAANGKNKVTYSLSAPGTTPNTAGDIWFQKDSLTQTIIGQWQGQGGTSWQQVTLNDQVIANLDAGKLVAGSAFTNALSVKTNFTLGDASTNGVIQTYNFAGSSVGVYIDKFGLVAKGGSVAGATITGGVFQTATSGQRVVIDGTSNAAKFYDSSGTQRGTIVGLSTGMRLTGAGAAFIQVATTGVGIGGNTSMDTFNTVGDGSMGGNLNMTFFAINQVGAINSGGGDIPMDATIKPDECYLTNLPTSSGGTDVQMGGSGRLFKISSSRRYKTAIKNADTPSLIDKLRQVRVRQWRYKKKYADPNNPTRLHIGGIAEELEDLGLGEFIVYDDEGHPDAINEKALVWPLLAWVRELEQRHERKIAGLNARIEQLESH